MSAPPLRVRRTFYRAVLFVADAALLSAALEAAFNTRDLWASRLSPLLPVIKGDVPPPSLNGPLEWGAVVVWMATFALSGFYKRVNLPFADEFLRVLKGVFTGWIAILAGTYLYRGAESSRLALAMSGAYAFALLLSCRVAARLAYRHLAERWWETHAVLVLGGGRMSKAIQQVLAQHPDLLAVNKVIRDALELERYLKANSIREVFVGEPDMNHATLIDMSEICDRLDVPFRIVPDILELRMGEVVLDTSLGLPTFQIKSMSLHGWTYFYKRLFDVVTGLAVVSLAIFPILFIAFLIKIDSRGPILHRQWRVGHKGRLFPFFKFRSMVSDAEARLGKLLEFNERAGRVFKMKRDPRVTRVGRVLRKYSLDEVPQILNVLRGEMSLVGPRPQLPRETEGVGSWERKRLNVLPGMTGLWQVSGRAQLTYEEMIELDIYYIEYWSPGLDLQILLKTVPTVLGGDGAY